MKNIEDTLQRLEKIMAATMERNPHSAGIISSFRPIIIARTRLIDDLDLPGDDSLTLDEDLFKEGVPLGKQNACFRESDPFEAVAISLMPALKAGFPALNGIWERFTGLMDARAIRLYDFFRSFPSGGEEVLGQWAQQLDADIRVVGFIVRSVARVILERRALNWAGLLTGFEWEKGFCPVCGSLPNISKHQEGTGQRWLHCPMCSHEWRFRRVVCPCCGNDDQKAMSYFSIEDKEQESAFACEMCKSYLITVPKVSDLAEYHPDIAALGLAHLDIVMQEKGYLPMAQTEWSAFA